MTNIDGRIIFILGYSYTLDSCCYTKILTEYNPSIACDDKFFAKQKTQFLFLFSKRFCTSEEDISFFTTIDSVSSTIQKDQW